MASSGLWVSGSSVVMSSLISKDSDSAVSREFAKKAGLFSSTLSYRSNRTVADLAVDIATQFVERDLDKTVPGDRYNDVVGHLGEREYECLMNDTKLTLVKIYYCGRALSDEAMGILQSVSEGSQRSEVTPACVEKIKEIRGLINHDYLILELQRGSGDAPRVFIHAEKIGGPKKAGIHFRYLDLEAGEVVPSRLHSGVKVYEIKCGQFMPFHKLIEKLKEADANYNLRTNNCWDYACATTKSLLRECSVAADITEAENVRLREECNGLEGNLNRYQLANFIKLIFERATNAAANAFSAWR